MSVNLTLRTHSAAATTRVGREMAKLVRAGDLLIMRGGLGAGKTTFTQGLGQGLDVSGRVTSPTFIIAREHPANGEGPALIHADAYRIETLEQLETLDLDTSLDAAVTVVEWGEGKVEGLTEDHLLVTLERLPTQLDTETTQTNQQGWDLDENTPLETGNCQITFSSNSPRWVGENFRQAFTFDQEVELG